MEHKELQNQSTMAIMLEIIKERDGKMIYKKLLIGLMPTTSTIVGLLKRDWRWKHQKICTNKHIAIMEHKELQNQSAMAIMLEIIKERDELKSLVAKLEETIKHLEIKLEKQQLKNKGYGK